MPDPPIMTFGKNLNGLAVLKDRTTLITKLYPRGGGSSPSEVALDTPHYYPAGQILRYHHEDAYGTYFTLPNPYSSFAGFTKAGDYLPTGYYVGKGINSGALMLPQNGNDSFAKFGPEAPSIWGAANGVAEMFYMEDSFAIYSIALQLQRLILSPDDKFESSTTSTINWTTQPRFVVGLYSATPSKNIPGYQGAGYWVPYQGPYVWCYGNLLSIAADKPQWYTFPMQNAIHGGGGWWAIVIMPYPTSNKQWSIQDFLSVGTSPSREGSHTNCYAGQCRSGVTPKNWIFGWTQGDPSIYANQLAFQLNLVGPNVSTQFHQADPYGGQPGRFIFQNKGDYVPGTSYVFHYQHAPYLVDWDNLKKYGKFEGTFKDDSITTQSALLAAGSNYLASVSQPSMTISLGAVDLYNIDPDKNLYEELFKGGLVRVIDDVIGLDETCIITKIDKQDLTQPHIIDTLTLNNVHLNAQKLLAQVAMRERKIRSYTQGQTVEAPYTTVTTAANVPATLNIPFAIRDITTLTHALRLTVSAPDGAQFQIDIDGTPVV